MRENEEQIDRDRDREINNDRDSDRKKKDRQKVRRSDRQGGGLKREKIIE